MKSSKEKMELLALKEAVDEPMEYDMEKDTQPKMYVCPKCKHKGTRAEFED